MDTTHITQRSNFTRNILSYSHLTLFLSLVLSHSPSLSFYLTPSLSHSVSLTPSLSVSLSVSLPLSVSPLSLPPPSIPLLSPPPLTPFLTPSPSPSPPYSAVGQTVGAFHRRDCRGDDAEILVARLIDRPIRPMIAGKPVIIKIRDIFCSD